MTRSPFFLAALASSAVPGLDPVTVESVPGRPDDLFEIAYVQDSQDRRWVIKAPRTSAAGAMLDDISALSGLLGRRLEVAMPMPRGLVQVPEGRAAVYLRIPGRPLDFAGLRPGPLTTEVGRTLAHIHNVEHLLFEEAGRPTYDAEAHRRRQLSELDRAAATGHVPTGLLTRWEHTLEDVSLWRFAPSAVHGTFTGDNVLASFDDEEDSSSGHVRGVLAWEASRVGDPADDFAELARVAPPATLDALLEAYAASRIERPDVHLVHRARLAAEMTPLRTLLRALAAGQLDVVERTAERLRALDAAVEADDERHGREDAARSERTRQSLERAARAPDPDDPERAGQPEPEWDATQPHVPFPMLGETQAISSTPLGDGAGKASEADARMPAVADDDPIETAAATPPDTPTEGATSTDPASTEAPQVEATTPADEHAAPQLDDSQPVPVAAADASPFEIDEVEALPADVDSVLDLHEGASDFVPVTTSQHPHHDRTPDP